MTFDIFFTKNNERIYEKTILSLIYLFPEQADFLISKITNCNKHTKITIIDDTVKFNINNNVRLDRLSTDEFITSVNLLKIINDKSYVIPFYQEIKYYDFINKYINMKIKDITYNNFSPSHVLINNNIAYLINFRQYDIFFNNITKITTSMYIRNIKLKKIL